MSHLSAAACLTAQSSSAFSLIILPDLVRCSSPLPEIPALIADRIKAGGYILLRWIEHKSDTPFQYQPEWKVDRSGLITLFESLNCKLRAERDIDDSRAAGFELILRREA